MGIKAGLSTKNVLKVNFARWDCKTSYRKNFAGRLCTFIIWRNVKKGQVGFLSHTSDISPNWLHWSYYEILVKLQRKNLNSTHDTAYCLLVNSANYLMSQMRGLLSRLSIEAKKYTACSVGLKHQWKNVHLAIINQKKKRKRKYVLPHVKINYDQSVMSHTYKNWMSCAGSQRYSGLYQS